MSIWSGNYYLFFVTRKWWSLSLIMKRPTYQRERLEERPVWNRATEREPKPGMRKFHPGNGVVLRNYGSVPHAEFHRLFALENLYDTRKKWAKKPENWRYVLAETTGLKAEEFDFDYE